MLWRSRRPSTILCAILTAPLESQEPDGPGAEGAPDEAVAPAGTAAAPPAFGELDEDYNSLVGSIRALYRLTDSWNIFSGASQGFRAPTSPTSPGSMWPGAARWRPPRPTWTPRST